MTHIAVQNIEKKFINKKTPVLRPGYQVRVHQKIKEGEKERVQVFEGLVISLNAGHGSSKTFKVRKIVEGIGVEKTFPLYSPNIVKIEIKKTFKARRAKLTYLRKPEGLSKRLSAKLGLVERDEVLKKKKGLEEEVVAEEPTTEASIEAPVENQGENATPPVETTQETSAQETTPKSEASSEETSSQPEAVTEETAKEEPATEESAPQEDATPKSEDAAKEAEKKEE